MKTKLKTIGGHEYVILGSTTEMERGRVVYQSYTVPGGKVKVEHGKVWHRDGTITDTDGKIIEANTATMAAEAMEGQPSCRDIFDLRTP